MFKHHKLHINLRNGVFWYTTQASKAPVIFTNEFASLKHKYNPTKYPIVLCHGLSGFDTLTFLPRPNFWHKGTVKKVIKKGLILVDYWYGIQDTLKNIGCDVYIGKVPPFGSIEQRATTLHEFLEAQFETPTKVNLIAHSMGGLDSRYLVSQFESRNYQVESLTTVSTPHRGSEVADFVEAHVKPGVILPQAIRELTLKSLAEFNKKIVDDKSVAYYSYGARFHPRWFNVFKYPWNLIRRAIVLDNKLNNTHRMLDNDGMVSVESSQWGEYLGTLDEVDHLDLINWTNRLRTVVDKSLFNHQPSFNALAFYSHIIHSLADRGH